MRAPALVALLAATVALSGCTFPQSNGGNVGSKAHDYLTGTGTLTLEIDYVDGSAPNRDAVAALRSALGDVTGRTVRDVQNAQLPTRGASSSYSFNDLASMSSKYRDLRDSGDDHVIHVLYLDGTIPADDGQCCVIGVAYNGENIAISKQTIRDVSCAPNEEVLGRCVNTQAREVNVERAVLIHEAGHILGLVNAGTPMTKNHEDPDHPGHSSNKASVMWWQVETPGGIQALFDGGANIPSSYDSDDRADLRAAKAGG